MICDKWLHIYGNKLGTGVNCEWVDAVRENVRGEWIKEKGSLWTLATCSVCGELSVEGDKPFCPNCGADMRGEKGNDERI